MAATVRVVVEWVITAMATVMVTVTGEVASAAAS